jgi:hypothetical protein
VLAHESAVSEGRRRLVQLRLDREAEPKFFDERSNFSLADVTAGTPVKTVHESFIALGAGARCCSEVSQRRAGFAKKSFHFASTPGECPLEIAEVVVEALEIVFFKRLNGQMCSAKRRFHVLGLPFFCWFMMLFQPVGFTPPFGFGII